VKSENNAEGKNSGVPFIAKSDYGKHPPSEYFVSWKTNKIPSGVTSFDASAKAFGEKLFIKQEQEQQHQQQQYQFGTAHRAQNYMTGGYDSGRPQFVDHFNQGFAHQLVQNGYGITHPSNGYNSHYDRRDDQAILLANVVNATNVVDPLHPDFPNFYTHDQMLFEQQNSHPLPLDPSKVHNFLTDVKSEQQQYQHQREYTMKTEPDTGMREQQSTPRKFSDVGIMDLLQIPGDVGIEITEDDLYGWNCV
jgi:hypothetical protein